MVASSSRSAGSLRFVSRVVRGVPTTDGAGVRLTRLIGQPELSELDPFLLLDEFGTDRPGDYIAGFPDHPHRGFETVTYMLDGRMRHRDNHGHEGLLVPGSVQWMTAGRGIVHSEMPQQQEGRMRGFQLWLNLPAAQKMTAPRYQEFDPDRIPTATPAAGVAIKVIAGEVGGIRGPISQPATEPTYLDTSLESGASFGQSLPPDHTALLYVYEGACDIGSGAGATRVSVGELAVLGAGDSLQLTAATSSNNNTQQGPSRAILVAGRPLHEPVARYGPFVMNTREEIIQAVTDYQSGKL